MADTITTTVPDDGTQTVTTPATPDGQANTGKTFTQDEVSGIAAKEAKKAQESLLKKLGLGEDIKSVQEGLTKFAEWQNAQKSDLEKANDAAKTAKEAMEAATSKAATLELENACLRNGVLKDYVSDVALLAKSRVNENTDVNAAIAAIVSQYPHFTTPPATNAATVPLTKPVFSAQTQTGTTPELQKRIDEVRRGFGLKPN